MVENQGQNTFRDFAEDRRPHHLAERGRPRKSDAHRLACQHPRQRSVDSRMQADNEPDAENRGYGEIANEASAKVIERPPNLNMTSWTPNICAGKVRRSSNPRVRGAMSPGSTPNIRAPAIKSATAAAPTAANQRADHAVRPIRRGGAPRKIARHG